jgi:hypothetical protein
VIHPWHKSPLFYLGLAPLLFLLWAWWDSCSRASGFNHWRQGHTNGLGLTVVSVDSKLTMRCTRTDGVKLVPFGVHGDFLREEVFFEEPSDIFPPAKASHMDQSEPGNFEHHIYHVTLPHWLLILTYLALWSLLLFWRSRRIKRLSRLKISA